MASQELQHGKTINAHLNGCCRYVLVLTLGLSLFGLAYRQFYRFKELFDEKDKKGLLGLAALLKEDGRECFYWCVRYEFYCHLRRTRVCNWLVAYTPRPLRSIFIRTIANPFTPRLTKEQEKVLWEFADAYEAMNHEDLNDELMFGWKIIADSDGIKSICKNIRHYAEW